MLVRICEFFSCLFIALQKTTASCRKLGFIIKNFTTKNPVDYFIFFPTCYHTGNQETNSEQLYNEMCEQKTYSSDDMILMLIASEYINKLNQESKQIQYFVEGILVEFNVNE